jgi:hypothetical protein
MARVNFVNVRRQTKHSQGQGLCNVDSLMKSIERGGVVRASEQRMIESGNDDYSVRANENQT